MQDFRPVLQRFRPWQYLSTPVRGGMCLVVSWNIVLILVSERLRVVSYNVLASSLADPTLYPAMSPHLLDWGFRRDRLIAELRAWDADIVCLQVRRYRPSHLPANIDALFRKWMIFRLFSVVWSLLDTEECTNRAHCSDPMAVPCFGSAVGMLLSFFRLFNNCVAELHTCVTTHLISRSPNFLIATSGYVCDFAATPETDMTPTHQAPYVSLLSAFVRKQ